MKTLLSASLALSLLLPGAYAAAQDTPQAAAERCKDIEQQGPNKMQQGARSNEAPPSSDKVSDAGAGTLNEVTTRAGAASKDADIGRGDNKGMAMGPGTQDCVVFVNPNDKPQ
jgi:hypothetical protein